MRASCEEWVSADISVEGVVFEACRRGGQRECDGSHGALYGTASSGETLAIAWVRTCSLTIRCQAQCLGDEHSVNAERRFEVCHVQRSLLYGLAWTSAVQTEPLRVGAETRCHQDTRTPLKKRQGIVHRALLMSFLKVVPSF